MDTLHIGGVADGESADLPENVMTGRHSFKLSRDFLSDPLRITMTTYVECSPCDATTAR